MMGEILAEQIKRRKKIIKKGKRIKHFVKEHERKQRKRQTFLQRTTALVERKQVCQQKNC